MIVGINVIMFDEMTVRMTIRKIVRMTIKRILIVTVRMTFKSYCKNWL
jgi:hypothetical protein